MIKIIKKYSKCKIFNNISKYLNKLLDKIGKIKSDLIEIPSFKSTID